MITMIIKQMWNSRRANMWIFIELVLAGYFLWSVTDSLYYYAGNSLVPDGHSADECYVVDVDYVAVIGPQGDKEAQIKTPMERRETYINIIKAVRDLPEVEYYCVAERASIPGGNITGPGKGTLEIQSYNDLADILLFTALPELDDEQPFATYGIIDAETGSSIILPQGVDRVNDIYISEEYAKSLYGTTRVKGKEIDRWGSKCRIAGVYKDFKTSYKYYVPLEHSIITFEKDFRTHASYYSDMGENYPIVIRLKEGVERASFEKRFNEEIAPTLSSGFFHCRGVVPVSRMQEHNMKFTGGEGEIKMNIALSLFALGCIFLGMVGCFWIRANSRRGEIGLMRSVGASRKRIILQFLAEAAILVTLAYIVAAPFLVKSAKESIYYNSAYEIGYIIGFYLEKIPHFIMHTGCSYAIMLATALIGTFIAVNRVVEHNPAAALKEI